MMDGSVSVDPNTGAETVMEGFKNAWQILGAVSGGSSGLAMDMTSMCNMNLMYFAIAVLACLFIAEDFRSGYAKNLFTVRAKRNEYIDSKLILILSLRRADDGGLFHRLAGRRRDRGPALYHGAALASLTS